MLHAINWNPPEVSPGVRVCSLTDGVSSSPAAPQVFLEGGGEAVRTASTCELYDVCLVQNDLLKAISDPGYFSQRIAICQENYEKNVQQGATS